MRYEMKHARREDRKEKVPGKEKSERRVRERKPAKSNAPLTLKKKLAIIISSALAGIAIAALIALNFG
ncbi:MAG: hypothetical protein JW770_00465, partial [Actinobacteria bacterium]|nr:hypothetical protein [Actinomycetota bacterium]